MALNSPQPEYNDTPDELEQFFASFGNELLAQWQQQGGEESQFPQLAAQALTAGQLTKKVNTHSLTQWVFAKQEFPKQQNIQSTFGDLALTVFACEQFYIEVLFWLNGTTTIHQHGFSGAFSVLQGSSIHSRYDFNTEYAISDISDSLVFGEVQFKFSEHLTEGDIREIHPGEQTAHALFHLQQPNISIVVRTYNDSSVKHQYTYLPPHIAYDPFIIHEQLDCQQGLLKTLYQIDKELFINAFMEHANNLDTESHAQLLLKNAQALIDTQQLNRAIQQFSQQHPELGDELLSTINTAHKNKTIVGWRSKTSDKELRFFLAVLLNAPNQQTAFQLIETVYSDHCPQQLVCQWLYQLAHHSGLENMELTEESLPFIQCLVKGYTFEQTLEELSSIYEQQELMDNSENLRGLYQHFLQDSIVKNLFT